MSKPSTPTGTNIHIPVDSQALKHSAIALRTRARHIVKEAVRALAVDSVIADQHVILAHAQRHTAYVLDEQHDERGPDGVPADDEERADDLQPDLLAVAIDGAAGIGIAEACHAGDGCEEACQEAAEETGDEVRMRDS
jgi:hypothetical protein